MSDPAVAVTFSVSPFDPDAERPCSCEETERLRAELWHVRFLSLMRGQMAAEWARLLDEERAAHAMTKRQRDSALRILGPESGTFISPGHCVSAAMAALR